MGKNMRSRRGWRLTAACLMAGAAPAAAACKLGLVATMPVTMNGLRPVTIAQVNGIDTPFLVDSGAYYSILSSGSAKRLGVKVIPVAGDNFTTAGVGGSADMNLAVIKDFTIAGQAIPKIPFLVGGNELGDDSGGLIGYNFLGIGETEYDLAKGVIRMFRTEGCDRDDFPFWGGPGQVSSELPLEPAAEVQGEYVFSKVAPRRAANRIVTTIYINGKPVKAQLDTGAGRSVISRAAALGVGIDVTNPEAKDIGFSGGLGKRRVRTWAVPVALIRIGDEEIRKASIEVIETIFDQGDGVDMLLGADFFLAHHIFVARKLNKLYLTYNGGKVFEVGTATGQ